MKILIFLKKWPGGVGVVVNSIKKEFEKKEHKVVCISREDDLNCFSSFKRLFWLRKKYIELIKKEKPHIIYTQDWSMALPLLFPYKIYNKKHFCCFHGNQISNTKFLQTFIGKLMKNRLVVVGDSLKDRFLSSNKIYNGIDFELFKPNKKINKIKNSVGFVNWKTGEYHYEKIYNACIKLGKEFIVAENIPYKKMPDFYNKLDCFISLPPKGAGFNMSWIEAMACGVPKIIGNNEGIGFKLDINYIEKFSSIKDSLINCKIKNPDFEFLKNNFGSDKQVNKLLKVFEI
jgi:glycosyltransferase involved in cell wall biosynthesis